MVVAVYMLKVILVCTYCVVDCGVSVCLSPSVSTCGCVFLVLVAVSVGVLVWLVVLWLPHNAIAATHNHTLAATHCVPWMPHNALGL